MKVLYCDFDEEWHWEILNELSDRLNADYVISISCINHNLGKKNRKYEWIDNEKLNYHRYAEFSSWVLPPLDSSILEKMEWCEILYYQMLDRSELVMSKNISFQERKKCYYADLQIMKFLLEKVDVCFFSSIPHVGFDYVLYGLCRVLKKPFVIQFYCTPIPGYTATIYFLQDIYNHIPEMNKIDYLKIDDAEILPKRMRYYYEYYGREAGKIKQVIEYSDFDNEYKKPSILGIIKVAIQRYNKGLLFATIRRRIENKIMIHILNSFFEKKCYRPHDEKYIYFPLHYQPECTSLPMGGRYYDQELVVEQLSNYVSKDVKIYVKPHPSRSWFADKEFYNRLILHKNVCLISPQDNTYDLMDSALAVVSLTGTVILEAMVRGVPVLMFGYYIWQYAPGVFHCKTNEDVKEALNQICNKGFRPNKNFLIKFFVELDKHLLDGSSVAMVNKICGISQDKCKENIINGYISYLEKIGVQID